MTGSWTPMRNVTMGSTQMEMDAMPFRRIEPKVEGALSSTKGEDQR